MNKERKEKHKKEKGKIGNDMERRINDEKNRKSLLRR